MLKFSTYNDLLENEGLKKKAEKSGVSLGTLKKVYNRGMAAWKTGHRPGTTPQQWAHARVNSYITKGKGTYHGADKDLRDDVQYEAHNPKHVKQAIGIASDPRYKKGNMTGAVKAMNKISKDIDKHPQVAAVLRKQNEAKAGANYADMKYHYMYHDDAKAAQAHATKVGGKVLKGSGKRGPEYSVKYKNKNYKESVDEATVKEISKNLARRYVNKAAIDMFHKGRDQGAADTIAKAGGQHPDQEYKGGPEFKGARRAGGIMRATRKLMKKEAMSDAEKKAHDAAIAAFKAKGGKVKKLKPGYAQGWTGKDDLGTGMKGMMSKDDTKGFGTSKKVGSMKR